MRRGIALLSTSILLAGAAGPAAASDLDGDPSEETIYQDKVVDVSHLQIHPGDELWDKASKRFRGEDLDGAYIGRLQIENVSDQKIKGWTLTFELSDSIEAMDKANVAAQRDNLVAIQDDPPTKVIQPGHVAEFLYLAQPDGPAQTPDWATFLEGDALPTEDDDGDGLPNSFEQRAGFDRDNEDTDGDGLSDFVEWATGSDPLKPDTDGDGSGDAAEDLDGDGVANRREVALKTSPVTADTDRDGADDGQELAEGSDPTEPDSDGDGVEDGEESAIGSDPGTAEDSFDVTREAPGEATIPSATIEGLHAHQVPTFQLIELPDDQAQFPTSTPGYIGNGYQLLVDGDIDEGLISFTTDAELEEPGLVPAIYRFDEEARQLVKVAGQRTDGDTVIAPVDGVAKYVVLNSQEAGETGPRIAKADLPPETDLAAQDMVIHQSANREGRRKEPDPDNFVVPPSWQVADDLTFNDYTYGELLDLGPVFAVARITPESWMWAELNDIFEIGKAGADTDNRVAVDSLRDTFRYGHDGQSAGSVSVEDDYDPAMFQQYGSGAALSRAVENSPQMQDYISEAGDMIAQSIVANQGDISQFEQQDDLGQNLLYQLFEEAGLQYPTYDFSLFDSNQRALSIAIHQFHGHSIELKDYEVSGNTFSGTLVFHSYDHFGLDPDDEVNQYGFVDWFTLQHYERFEGKYAPPIAVADVEVPILGSF